MFKIFETMSFLGIKSEAWDVYWQFNTFWNIFQNTTFKYHISMITRIALETKRLSDKNIINSQAQSLKTLK